MKKRRFLKWLSTRHTRSTDQCRIQECAGALLLSVYWFLKIQAKYLPGVSYLFGFPLINSKSVNDDDHLFTKISSATVSVPKRMSSQLEEDAAEVAQHIRVFHHVSAILGRKKGTWKKMHFYLHRTLPDPITQATVCIHFLTPKDKKYFMWSFQKVQRKKMDKLLS